MHILLQEMLVFHTRKKVWKAKQKRRRNLMGGVDVKQKGNECSVLYKKPRCYCDNQILVQRDAYTLHLSNSPLVLDWAIHVRDAVVSQAYCSILPIWSSRVMWYDLKYSILQNPHTHMMGHVYTRSKEAIVVEAYSSRSSSSRREYLWKAAHETKKNGYVPLYGLTEVVWVSQHTTIQAKSLDINLYQGVKIANLEEIRTKEN